jgi:maltodextrin utilization protein YvdJ
MKGEYTKRYISENIPRKSYHRGIVIRERKPFELFWQEILFMLFIISLLVMLAVNYVSNQEYVRQNVTQEEEREIDIGVNIQKQNNFDSVIFPVYPLYSDLVFF